MKTLARIGDGQSVPSRAYERIMEFIAEGDIVGGKLPPETALA